MDIPPSIAKLLIVVLHSAFFTLHLSWLPGMESHHHARLQRAMSCCLDDPAGRNGVMDWWSNGLMGRRDDVWHVQ